MSMPQWPLKILLVHPQAPFLSKNNIVIAADCSVLLRPELGNMYVQGTPVLIGCPLLEDPEAMMSKLKLILESSSGKNIEVISMEVPCCQALHMMVRGVVNEVRVNASISHRVVRVFTRNIEDWKPGVVDETMTMLERMAHGVHKGEHE